MLRSLFILIMFLPFISKGEVAEIVVYGDKAEIHFDSVAIKRLVPELSLNNTSQIKPIVVYAAKLMEAKSEGLDSMIENTLQMDDIYNDLLVSLWEDRIINDSLSCADLQKYFEVDRDQFHWDEPRFKGRIILSENDSINWIISGKNYKEFENNKAIQSDLIKSFGKKALLIDLLVTKGRNKYVDYIVFNEYSDFTNDKWKNVSIVDGEIISQPENYLDVYDLVVAKYKDEIRMRIDENLFIKYNYKVIER